jgi:uncharacterized protein (TIGR02453 family)
MTFTGVPDETFSFLRALAKHNDRTWFQAHRADYEAYWLEPAMQLVEAIGAKLRKVSPDVRAEPRVNGSIYRINRDIRFSKDKRPYKTHLDLMFPEGAEKWAPGYWFRLTPDVVMVGAGMHVFDGPLMDRYRHAVVDPSHGAALAAAVAKVRKAGYEVGDVRYKRVPRGFDPEHPRAELLLHNSLTAGTQFPAAEARSPRFPDVVVSHYRKIAPIQRWLVDLVGG